MISHKIKLCLNSVANHVILLKHLNVNQHYKMDAKKLERMQAQVRIGGKGTARRKKKTVYKTNTIADNKLQAAMQKIRVNEIPSVEEVNLFKDNGSVMHFENPRVKASFHSNMFALNGQCEDKQFTELIPGIFGQIGPEAMSGLAKLPRTMNCANTTDDKRMINSGGDVFDLLESFKEASDNKFVDAVYQEKLNDEPDLALPQEENDSEHFIGKRDLLAFIDDSAS